MIDNDGIERPDDPSAHGRKVVKGKRKLVFDENYHFYPRSVLFRMWAAFFRAAGICIFNPYTYFKCGVRTYGHKNKKELRHKPFIITCNHVHMLDDVCVGTNVFPERKIYYTTMENNIRRRYVGFFMRSLGGIPIPVSSIGGMKKFNSDVSYILNKLKKPVMYNPEGSMWPYYREIRPFKKGAFSIAVKNNVPILPILVTFKRKKKRNGKFKYKFFYTIGEPVYINENLSSEKEKVDDMLSRTHDWYVKTNKEWYETQDCGFGDHDPEKVAEKKKNKKKKTD